MTWMWIAGGILAGLYLVKRKINNNRYTTTDTQTQENREQDAHNDGKLYGKREIQEAVTPPAPAALPVPQVRPVIRFSSS